MFLMTNSHGFLFDNDCLGRTAQIFNGISNNVDEDYKIFENMECFHLQKKFVLICHNFKTKELHALLDGPELGFNASNTITQHGWHVKKI